MESEKYDCRCEWDQSDPGILNPAIDSLKMTAAGRTLEAVPWIGDVAGGTMDVALGVAVLLKNGIGVAGMIFIAVLALIPLVEFLILAFCTNLWRH